MTTLTITTFGIALLGTGALFSIPQDPQAKASKHTMVLATGEHDLGDLIDRTARFLGRNYLYHANEIRRQGATGVSLQTPLTLTRKSCLEFLEDFLFSQNFAVVPTNSDKSIWEVINMQGSRRSQISANPVSMTTTEVLENRHRKLYVECVVQVANLDASAVVTVLRPFFTTAGQAAPIQFGSPTKRSMMIGGFADQVAAAIDHIAEIDGGASEGAPAGAAPVPIVRKQLATIYARLDAFEKRLERIEARLD